MAEEEVGIAEFVLKGLINGALGKAGGDGFQEILDKLTGDKSDSGLAEMQQQLGQIADELADMRADLKDIEGKLAELAKGQQWLVALQTVDAIQFKVQSIFDDLRTAKRGDSSVPTEVVTWVNANNTCPLVAVHDLMTPYKLVADPSFVGMLSLFASTALCDAQGNPAYQRWDFQPGSLLDLDYGRMEKYFRSLVGLQIQIVTLLVNGYRHQGLADRANEAILMLQRHLVEQCDAFLWSVESYVVGYCVDDTLLSLLRRAAFVPDPIRRADRFANRYLYAPDPKATAPAEMPVDVFRVRVWGATSTDGSLDTQTFVPLASGASSGIEDGSGSGLVLSGAGGPLAPTASWHIVFGAQASKQWSLYRHTFLAPPQGVWTLAPPASGVGTFDVVVDPYSYDAVYNGPTSSLANGLWYAFGDDVRASDYHVALTARTMLTLAGQTYLQANATYDFRQSITFEAWTRTPQPGALICTALQHDSGDMAGVFSLGLTDDLVPYAEMSILWTESSYGQQYTKSKHNRQTSSSAFPGDGSWHHLAATLDHHQGVVAIYLDGQPLPSTFDGDDGGGWADDLYFDESALAIGVQKVDADSISANGLSFQGQAGSFDLSEVRVWGFCRSADDILGSYRRRIFDGGPQSLWNLDFGSISDATTYASLQVAGSGATLAPMAQPDWLSLPPIANAWEAGHETPSDVYLAALGRTLYLAYRDGTNAVALQSSKDGVTWTPLPPTSIYVSSSPALTQTVDLDGAPMLMLAYRQYDPGNGLGYATSYDGQTWSTASVDLGLRGTPGFLTNGATNGPCALCRAIDGQNALWLIEGEPVLVDTITLQGDPTGWMFVDGTSFVAFRADDPSHTLFVAVSNDTTYDRGWPVLAPDGAPVTLNGSPSMIADANGVLWIALRWQDQVRIVSISRQAASVQGPTLAASSVATVAYPDDTTGAVTAVPARTSGSPSLMISGSTMYLAYRDRDDPGTYWVTTSADGLVWTAPARIATKWEQSLPPAAKAATRAADAGRVAPRPRSAAHPEAP